MLVCSAAWLFSAPAEVESPDDGSRRTRLLAPTDTLGHNPHCLGSTLRHCLAPPMREHVSRVSGSRNTLRYLGICGPLFAGADSDARSLTPPVQH
jgi:hypothetical protein